MITIERCPACGGNLRPCFDVDVEGATMAVSICARCRSYVKSPYYEPAELPHLYTHYDHHEMHYEPAQGEIDNIVSRIDRIRRFLPAKGTLLEVGCGRGYFLRELVKRGWDARGLEFEGSARSNLLPDMAKRVEFVRSEDDFAGIAPATFDVVTSYQVMEHLLRPADTMGRWTRVLRPGGLMVVNTPNAGSLGSRVHKGAWMHHRRRDHFVLYTRTALERLFRDNGVRVVHRFYGGQPPVFSKSPTRTAAVKRLYRSRSLTRFARSIVYSLGLGDNIEIIGRKT